MTPEEFNGVIDRIMLATGAKTQVDLAKLLAIRQSSVSDAKRRKSIPPGWYITLMERYGLNYDWIRFGSEDIPQYYRDEQGNYRLHNRENLVSEPVASYGIDLMNETFSAQVHSMECVGSDEEGWEPKPLAGGGKIALHKQLEAPGLTVICMESSSMEPVIRRGGYVGLDIKDKRIVSGELFGVYIPYEGLTIKRVYFEPELSRFVLRSYKDEHPEQYLPAELLEQRIVGRVRWVIQEM